MFKSFETVLSSKSKGRLKYGFAERLRDIVALFKNLVRA
jgi:hypothetical protein